MVQEAYQVKYFVSENTNKDNLLSLSIFVSANSFQYGIFTHDFKMLLELADVELKDAHLPESNSIELINLLIHNYYLNQKQFEKISISFLNNKFTLMPESFADALDNSLVLGFSGGQQKNSKVLKHKTKHCHFCFSLPNDWLDYFGKTFPNASIRHAGGVNVSLLFEQFSLVNTQLYLNIHKGQLEICVKANNQLQFYNVFSYESKEDILYFLLFTMEQLGLNPLLCKLTLAGEMDTTSDLIRSIKKYVKQVDFCVFDKSLVLTTKANEIPAHYYFTLLNQHLCAL